MSTLRELSSNVDVFPSLPWLDSSIAKISTTIHLCKFSLVGRNTPTREGARYWHLYLSSMSLSQMMTPKIAVVKTNVGMKMPWNEAASQSVILQWCKRWCPCMWCVVCARVPSPCSDTVLTDVCLSPSRRVCKDILVFSLGCDKEIIIDDLRAS